MITLDTATFFVLLLAVAAGGALLAILPAWRHLMGEGASLPVWGFLRRRRIMPVGRAALQAEVRCEMCSSHAQCREILSRGGERPPAGCPNAALFAAEIKEAPCART